MKGLADYIGLKRQSAYMWQDIPLEWLAEASEYSGILPHQLRPDLAFTLQKYMPRLPYKSSSESGVSVDNILLALSDHLSEAARARIEAQTRGYSQPNVDRGKDRAPEAAA